MWIQNVSYDDVASGIHPDPGDNSILIQIVDPDCDFPIPKHKFREIHRFKFLDIEPDDECLDPNWRVSQQQCDQLVEVLRAAMSAKANVIVHCMFGLSRSGAVCEVGVLMGFDDTHKLRDPNRALKNGMLTKLGVM